MARRQGLHSWAARRPVAVVAIHLAEEARDMDRVPAADACGIPVTARGAVARGRLGLFRAAVSEPFFYRPLLGKFPWVPFEGEVGWDRMW